ncbi:hypothetical protein DPEC_G00357490 [Dallia pectoralis]|uniref:Uncharacterized protein n=1 Tax=Dallia pectoralis TaxID=75939 RepID=A0ACC2F014_DALPE|nr:hypothetical protein DPEC_G00357490 [Dallia pectoralis]
MGDQKRFAISARIIGMIHGESTRVKMFMTSILWSDESEVVVYRSFPDFRNLHRRLKKRFPVENLLRKREKRIPKFRAMTMWRKIQEKRPSWSVRQMKLLQNYCTELLQCDNDVARCSDVTEFLCPKSHDLQADFTKNSIVILPSEEMAGMSGHRLSMGNVTHPCVTQSYCCVAPYVTKDTKNKTFEVALGERLDVLIKDPAGWWLVENEKKQLAWFPAPYLETCEEHEDEDDLDGIPARGMIYCAVRSYSTKKADEVSVPIGSAVEVLRKSDDGWWLIRYNGRAGYIPSMYLQPSNYPCAGLHTLQSKLYSSSLCLATQMNSASLDHESSVSSFAPTRHEKTELQQRTTSQPMSNQRRPSRLQKSCSLELLSETLPRRTAQIDEEDLTSGPCPSSRNNRLTGVDSFDSDISSSGSESLGGSVKVSSSSSSEDEPQRLSQSPQTSNNHGESSSSPTESFSPSTQSEAGSCKMPMVPPRPKVHEILTRCTTVTRKAALAFRVNLVSEQDDLQSR